MRNRNRKRNKLVASVVAGIGLMVLVGAVVFIETYRTIQGHPDGAALTIPTLMAGLAGITGVALGVRWRRNRHNS